MGGTIGPSADGGPPIGPGRPPGRPRSPAESPTPSEATGRMRDCAGEASPRLPAIVLAAGGATRLDGRSKPLLRVDGIPMVRRVLTAVQAAPSIERIIVVLGHRADEVAGALAGSPVALVMNPEYRTGRTSSIRCGLRECPESAAGVLLLHADQPFLEPRLIEALACAVTRDGAPAAAVAIGDELATPFAFGAAMLPQLRGLADGEGPCMLLRELGSAVARVRVDDPRLVADIDSLEDYRAWTGDLAESPLP